MLLLSVKAGLLIRYLLTNANLLTHGHIEQPRDSILCGDERVGALCKGYLTMSHATMAVYLIRCACQPDFVPNFSPDNPFEAIFPAAAAPWS